MNIRPGGFTEAGLCTTDLEGWVEFLTVVAGYRILWRNDTEESIGQFWGLPPEASVQECLLGSPASPTGLIRLYKIEGVRQDKIRDRTHAWDSGGIFDLEVRVPSMKKFSERMKRRGWQDSGPPVNWPFGKVEIREWLASSPDSVTLALIELLTSTPQGVENLNYFGQVFNSSQIVSDMNRALTFYEKLGFRKAMQHSGPLGGRGGEVFGLTPAESAVTDVDLVLLAADRNMNGTIQLIKIHGKPGGNVAFKCLPYNLGLSLLRFPVKNLRTYMKQMRQQRLIPINKRWLATRLEPFGETEITAYQSPDGARLEFYEAF